MTTTDRYVDPWQNVEAGEKMNRANSSKIANRATSVVPSGTIPKEAHFATKIIPSVADRLATIAKERIPVFVCRVIPSVATASANNAETVTNKKEACVTT
jgi:hypothetical protein